MRSNALLAVAFALAVVLPVGAQNYNYSYGNSRVVQGGNGLAAPSSSYIGAGTMSRSARGLPPQGNDYTPNPGLPAVNMGANIRTPGDNQYRPKPQSNGLPVSRMGANIGTAGDNMRSDLRYYQQQQRPMYPYQPQQGQQGSYYVPRNGVATYGQQSTDSNARRF